MSERTYVLEGVLTKDEPLGWQSHYKLSGKWIEHWLRDTLPKLPAGARIRIQIEVLPASPLSGSKDDYERKESDGPQ